MNFFEYYYSISTKGEQLKFRNRIMEVCKIKLQTWYSWFRRGIVSPQSQILISNELGIPQETLFPEKEPAV